MPRHASSRVRRMSRACGAVIESLERRTLLSDLHFNWIVGSGDWTNPANWDHTPPTPPEPDRFLPTSQDTVTIFSAGTVTISNGRAKALNLAAELRFAASGALNLYGDLNLFSGALVTFAGTFSGLSFEND